MNLHVSVCFVGYTKSTLVAFPVPSMYYFRLKRTPESKNQNCNSAHMSLEGFQPTVVRGK